MHAAVGAQAVRSQVEVGEELRELARGRVLPVREVAQRLARGEFDRIDHAALPFFRDVADRFLRVVDLAESDRELLGAIFETYQSTQAQRLNEVMKVLTAVSTIILPMTLISGIYGMNFQEMPELHWSMGYPMALFLMTVAGSATYWFYRKRGWL